MPTVERGLSLSDPTVEALEAQFLQAVQLAESANYDAALQLFQQVAGQDLSAADPEGVRALNWNIGLAKYRSAEQRGDQAGMQSARAELIGYFDESTVNDCLANGKAPV